MPARELRVPTKTEQDQLNSDQSQRPLTPAAQRALQEAEQRRRARDAASADKPAEHGGRNGPEPTRYGDWEKGGIVSDF
jgi:hypothetical protein